jgi:DnaJ-class molecular chaperone
VTPDRTERARALTDAVLGVQGAMERPPGENDVRLRTLNGEAVEGQAQRLTVEGPPARNSDGTTSNLVVHVRMEDVEGLETTRRELTAELSQARRENVALTLAMRRAVRLLPPEAQNEIRRAYREAVGGSLTRSEA